MDKKLQELLKSIKTRKLENGFNDTLIPEFKIIKTSVKHDQVSSVYKPSLCIVLQGSKDVIVGDKIYSYSPGEYIFTTVEVPVTGRITKASLKDPYLCLMLEIEPAMIFEVLKNNPSLKSLESTEKSGTFVSKVDSRLYDSFLRLVECMKTPNELSFMTSILFKEIIFRILNDPNGDVVRQLGIAGSQTQKIANAISIIKKKFNSPLNIEKLAKEVGMSPSSFHKYFKDITNMSPLQYQKLIRLQEARRLLLSGFGDAATIGFEIGYESPSQFSREYSRFFGKPPKQDLKQLQSK